MTKDLKNSLIWLRKIEMTPDQLREQRRSFAMGILISRTIVSPARWLRTWMLA